MSLVPASIKAPALPQVNLMPPEVASKRARGRQRSMLMLTLLLFAMLLAGLTFYVDTVKSTAESDLEAEKQVTEDLNNQISKLSYVPAIRNQMNNAEDARLYAGASEVNWGKMFQDFSVAMPDSVSITLFSWNLKTPLTVVDPSTDIQATADIGEISFAGVAGNYYDIAQMSALLNASPFFEGAAITGGAINDDQYEFSATVRVNARNLTQHFTKRGVNNMAFDDYAARAARELKIAKDLGTAADVAEAENRDFVFSNMVAMRDSARYAEYVTFDAQQQARTDPDYAEGWAEALQLLADARGEDVDVAREAFNAYRAVVDNEDALALQQFYVSYATQRLAEAEAELTYGIDGAQDRIDRATADLEAAQTQVDALLAVQPDLKSATQAPLATLQSLVVYRQAEADLGVAEDRARAAVIAALSGSDSTREERTAALAALAKAQAAYDAAKADLISHGVTPTEIPAGAAGSGAGNVSDVDPGDTTTDGGDVSEPSPSPSATADGGEG